MAWEGTMRKVLLIPALFILWGCSGDDDPVTPDTTPPTVIATSPADGDSNVDINAVITCTLSEPMDPMTITPSSFRLNDGYTGSVFYGNKIATYVPDSSLGYGDSYYATVTSDVADASGNHLESNYTWSFTTTHGVIMPLTVGNMWEYYVSEFDTFPMPDIHYYDTVQIIRDTLINAEQWFVDQDGVGYTNRVEGLWRWWKGNPDNLYFSLPYPANIGGGGAIAEEGGMTYISVAVANMDTLISVPAGTFHCILYKGGSFGPLNCVNNHYIFYAPNIGFIKHELYRKYCRLTGLRVLLSSKINIIGK
jgi:hypothetical protein